MSVKRITKMANPGLVKSPREKNAHVGRGTRTIEILRSVDEIRAVQAEWERFLLNMAGDHDVRQQPMWIINEIEYSTDPIKPFVVVVRDRGIRCIAPFYVMDRKIPVNVGPFVLPSPTFTLLRTFGDRIVHGVMYSETENVRILLEGLRPFTNEFDAIWLPEMRVPGDFWNLFECGKAICAGFRLIIMHPHRETVQQIQLPASFDRYMSALTSKKRHRLMADTKKLERAGASRSTMSVYTKPDDVRLFLSIADDIRNNSWKAKVFSPDRWKNEKRIRFHEEIAAHGWLRAYVVSLDGRPIAYQFGYPYRQTFVGEETAYVEDARAVAPGVVLMLWSFEDLCEELGACQVIMQPTDNSFKRTVGNESFEIGHALVVANTTSYNRLVFGTQRFLAFQNARLARLAKRLPIRRARHRR